MTSQKPKCDSTAEKNFSSETYLPRSTPSISKPPSLTLSILCFWNACLICWRFIREPQARRWRGRRRRKHVAPIERHPNRLHLGIRLEGVGAHLAPEAGLLVAAEGRARVEAI